MSTTAWSCARQKVPYVLSVVRLLLLPAVGIILLQCLSAYQQNFDESVFFGADWFKAIGIRFIYNYLILLIPYVILYALPFFKVSSIVLNTMVFIFGLAEHYVIIFRNTIIFPWDFTSIALAAQVSRTYDFVISREVVCSALLFAAMIGLSLIGREFKMKVWVRAIILVAIITSGSLYFCLFVTNKDAQSRANIRFYYTTVNYSYENGTLLNFCYQLRFVIREKPAGYSAADAKESLAAFDTTTASVVPDNEKPDVIMVMSEAFCDPRNIGTFDTSEPFMPFWDSLSGNNVIKKTLLTSAFGGNTANSEFEVLTGMSMQFFPSGTYPYKQYIRQSVPSFASIMKSNGYKTLSAHPFDLSGWNRNKVMPLLGFDSFVGTDAINASTMYRSYVSDQSAYQYIINQYESEKSANPDTPLLEYLISIQNHGGYSSTETLPYTIKPKLFSEYPQTSQYLSLLRVSDDALKMLISYFEKIDHPTVIILYGDHLPNITDNFYDYLKLTADTNDPMYPLTRYETKLLVWANYDISNSELAKIEEPYISTNYVSTYLSDIVGVQRTNFQQFLFEMHEEIPALDESYIVDKSGNVYNSDSKTLPADIKTWLDKYKKYQYFELYDSAK